MNIPDNAGYVFNFQGHGAFDPNGRVSADADDQAIARHNAELAEREIREMRINGRALLYYFPARVCPDGFKRDFVGTWDSSTLFMVCNQNSSWHNIGGKRIDLWFRDPDGATWHGVNIGDNDIVRCKRNK